MATFPINPTTGDPSISGALQALDSNNYSHSNFSYPLDIGTPGAGNDHFMVFHIYQPNNSQYTTVTAPGGSPQTTGGSNPTAQINNTNATGSNGTGTAASPTQMTNISQNLIAVSTTIVLYMPENIQSNYRADWETVALGAATDLINYGEGKASLTEVMTSIGVAGVKNFGEKTNQFTGLSLDQAISRATNMAINPHREVIFNGIGFRTFNFKFKMTPTSEAEATNIDNIVRAFKFYAAPEILQSLSGRFWIYPAEFDIQYYSNGTENLFLNRISTCALTEINVNYTGTGHWAAHRPHTSIQGNPPVSTEIDLHFTELEIMTKNRIKSGF